MLVASDFLSSRDISHFLWVVFTSMAVKRLIQMFLRCDVTCIWRHREILIRGMDAYEITGVRKAAACPSALACITMGQDWA